VPTALPMRPWIRARASLTPGAAAVIHGGRTVSWAELADRAEDLARGLRSRGVLPGDRVAALLGNDPDLLALLHAASLAGAVLVPLGPRHTPAEATFVLRDTDARLLVVPETGPLAETAALAGQEAGKTPLATPEQIAAAGRARDATQQTGVPTQSTGPGEASATVGAAGTTADPIAPDAPLAILHTSGTTGRPKGAVLAHGALAAGAVASAAHLGALPGERWLACMPLHHVGGLAIAVRAVLFGATVVLHGRFDPERTSRALDRDEIALASFVPTMLRRVLEARGERRAPRALRALLVGGAACPPELLERAWRAGWPALPTYGLTEAGSQVATLPPHEIGATDPRVSGRPLLGTQVEIRDEAARALPPGEPGEICVRGPTLMSGYWRQPEATAAALRGGWLHTGDAGLLTPEGHLRVLDRRRDLIVSGGENVYPAEVEAALLAHPDVADAGVAGEPDPDLGQRVAAWIVPHPDRPAPDLGALQAWLRPRLAAYKLPRALHAAASLPRTASGKLRRGALQGDAPPAPSTPGRHR